MSKITKIIMIALIELALRILLIAVFKMQRTL